MNKYSIGFVFLILFFAVNIGWAQDEYQTLKDISYYGDSIQQDSYMKSRCKLDLYAPKGKKNFPTVVWFHGGGITAGSKYIPEELMNKGVAVVAVNYRLSPKAKAPAYIEDAAAAVAWTFKHIGEYGGSDSLIFVSGHSAGGYLTMMVGFNKSYLSRFGIDANRIAGLVPFSGQTPTHFTIMAEQGLSDSDVRIDEYAPLYWIRADLPPTLIITGDREMELRGRYEEMRCFGVSCWSSATRTCNCMSSAAFPTARWYTPLRFCYLTL